MPGRVITLPVDNSGGRLPPAYCGDLEQCSHWFQYENQPGSRFTGIEQHAEPISQSREEYIEIATRRILDAQHMVQVLMREDLIAAVPPESSTHAEIGKWDLWNLCRSAGEPWRQVPDQRRQRHKLAVIGLRDLDSQALVQAD